MVEFLQSYGKVLGFEPAKDVPSLCALQEGLLGVGDSAGEVQDLLVRLLRAALYDPGLPPYCQVSRPRPPPRPGRGPLPGPARPRWGVGAHQAAAAAAPGGGNADPGGAALAAASCAPSQCLAALGVLPRPPSGCSPVPPAAGLWFCPGHPWALSAPDFPSAGRWHPPLSWQPPPTSWCRRGLPDPPLCSAQSLKILGEKVSEISLNRDTVSEILRCFLTAHGAGEELCEGLRTKPFQALPPERKAAILAFLVNELNSSALIIR